MANVKALYRFKCRLESTNICASPDIGKEPKGCAYCSCCSVVFLRGVTAILLRCMRGEMS